MKVLLVLLDGIADRSQAALGGTTPLQAAELPNLDALAAAGCCANLYPVAPGACPDASRSAWNILGYDDREFPGSAGIEALGAGVELKPGDIAFRVDLAATMIDGGERYVQVSPVSMPDGEAAALAAALSEFPPGPLGARLFHLRGASMVLVFTGVASELVTGSDPFFYRTPVRPARPLAGGGATAEETASELGRFAEWAREALSSHPVVLSRAGQGMTAPDFALVRDASVRPAAAPFRSKWGLDAVMLASGPLLGGLAAVFDMEFEEMASREAGEDLYDKLIAARAALTGGRDMAVVHSGAAAEASRSGRAPRKVRALEELDLAMTAVVEAFARDPGVLTVITSGFTSPSVDTDEVLNSGEPVPTVVLGKNVRTDRVQSFDEISCAGGCLGTLAGRDVMPLALSLANRAAPLAGRPDSRRDPWR